MKIFEKDTSSWDAKVNFVDDNDVFVGYDMGQSCCEHAGWFIADNVQPYAYSGEYVSEAPSNLDAYSFDKDFFEEIASSDLDEGGQVAFRLVAAGQKDLYLHLFNCHNGYYGHGFDVQHSGEVVKSGVL